MSDFVVLQHDDPRGIHFDLMLRTGDVLKTWALPQLPAPGKETIGELLADHRLAYLDYEGPLSDDRGSVTRWDRGTYRIERQDDSQWVVDLEGSKLIGRARLTRVPEVPDRWRFALLAE